MTVDMYAIMAEYDEKRRIAEDNMLARREKMYKNHPELKKIDDEIRNYGMKMTKLVVEGGLNEGDFKAMEKFMHHLILRKKEILLSLGKSEDYLEIKYSCKLCKDTGYLEDNNKCPCLINRINQELFKTSNIKDLIKKDNFQTYDASIFSEEISKKHGVSPAARAREAMKVCFEFIDGVEDKKSSNLLIYGETGTGKTFLCSSVAHALMNDSVAVNYQTSHNIADICRNYKFSDAYGDNTNDKRKYRSLFEDEVLIIDDLGTEGSNAFLTSELFNIINERIMGEKSTIISSNLGINDIMSKYGERIASRIIGNYKTIELIGIDQRVHHQLGNKS